MIEIGRCEDNPFRVMGGYNVNLSFGGRAANICRRLYSGRNRRRENDSGNDVWNRNIHGDSGCHGCPVHDFAVS